MGWTKSASMMVERGVLGAWWAKGVGAVGVVSVVGGGSGGRCCSLVQALVV